MKGRSLGPPTPPSIESERAGDEALNRLSPLERLAALAGDLARTPVLLDVQLHCRPSHCPQEGSRRGR